MLPFIAPLLDAQAPVADVSSETTFSSKYCQPPACIPMNCTDINRLTMNPTKRAIRLKHN